MLKPNLIILLHGFNSSVGSKSREIAEFLAEYHFADQFELITPKLDPDPRVAVDYIDNLIGSNDRRVVHLIGTSLGGFYALYFKAKFNEKFLIVHSINPSWTPSISLAPFVNQSLENFKTKESWIFGEIYLLRLEEYERYIQENLKTEVCKSLYLHISNSDEILKFDKMLNYLDKHKINYIKNIYDTDHRFRNIKEVMKLIVTI